MFPKITSPLINVYFYCPALFSKSHFITAFCVIWVFFVLIKKYMQLTLCLEPPQSLFCFDVQLMQNIRAAVLHVNKREAQRRR